MSNITPAVILAILTLFSCGTEPKSKIIPAPPYIGELIALLHKGDFTNFYETVAEKDLKVLREQFEQLGPEERARLNYGVLLNANIINNHNKQLFKPDIKKIDHYVDIPNDLKCWMNGVLYSIANSSFFDDFLEIDHIRKDEWEKRPQANLAIANKVLRSLREIIYEIRLSPHTTPERIAQARSRQIEALRALSELKIVASFYHELFLNYDLEHIEFIDKKSSLGNGEYKYIPWKHIPIDLAILTKALATSPPLTHLKGHGILGSIACNIEMSAGFVDIAYSHGLFIMLDPWGSMTRYLSASIKTNTADPVLSPKLQDPYHNKLVLPTNIGTAHFFFNDWYFKNSVSVDFRDVASKKSLGKIIYRQKARDSVAYMLVAKTRGSRNHIITELFNFLRKQFETHSFFGPSTFSPQESKAQTPYEDLTFYYLRLYPNSRF